jgi:hypothetical protein
MPNGKIWLNAILLGSLLYGGAAMANDRKDEDAARAADKAEKAQDKADVAESKAEEKAHRAERSHRRHHKAPRTKVIEERVIEEPAPVQPPAPAPETNIQINR